MFEIRVTVEAPDVCAAFRELAAAMTGTAAKPVAGTTTTPAEVKVAPLVIQAPARPVQAPQQAAVQPPQQFTQSAPNATMPPVHPPVAQPQNVQPQAPAVRQNTADEIARAGASLLDKGMMPQLISLLGKYNVQSITGLRPDQYPAFAADLKALGADL